ncbi:MAG: HAD family hydrolase [Anaerolineae bacterium]|nr:HAD family hydrolase [Anaerolineae bacterium]
MTTIKVILFDTGGTLYHRPREDRRLSAFLSEHNLTLRNRAVVNRLVRAARFDAQSGRIPRDTFYDAILRMHGLETEADFPAGREALLRDAADIELFPGVAGTLNALRGAGYRLGVISDSAHSAQEKIGWLAARDITPAVWSVFVVSSEIGTLKTSGGAFEHALNELGEPPESVVFVGHNTDELQQANRLGIATAAFMADDPSVKTTFTITSFYGLQDLFLSR